MRTLRTRDLTLEPQTAAHAEAMFALLSDAALYVHESAPPESLEWLRARFARLETRRSADGAEHWLNWVLRLPGGGLAGYVQATVIPQPGSAARAQVAYVLGSAHWGRGLARQAVAAMIAELAESYGVRALAAVLKRGNARSLALLEHLGFAPGSPGDYAANEAEADELVMVRALAPAIPAPAAGSR